MILLSWLLAQMKVWIARLQLRNGPLSINSLLSMPVSTWGSRPDYATSSISILP